MRRVVLLLLLVSALSVLLFASDKDKDFPLQVHIVRVDMAEGQRGVVGSGNTDSNGDYHSSVSGGGSYLYHIYIVHIDGDARELSMTTPASHVKGGTGMVVATMGWGALASHRNAVLHIGDYKGHWNKDGSLEIQFADEKSKLKHQPFFIRAESLLAKPQQ